MPDGLAPWRYVRVVTAPGCEGEAHVRAARYGLSRPGAPVLIRPGVTVTFGPLPPYRTLEWLSASGEPYTIREQRGAP